jgi:sn-glycerol 3-phosphate transport system ATP-binding protein
MAGIEIDRLTKRYREEPRALDGVDLAVAPGELLTLVGPSGSGKTTLLRLVAGLEAPTAGTIRLGGRDVCGVPPHQRNVALVFQNLALYGHLSVADNLSFGLGGAKTNNGQPKAEELVRSTAEMLGIEGLLSRYPAELSGGEQQRVALGRAVVRRPTALLLDEPLSSLDGPTRRSLRRELKRLQREQGMPTIYVTHDQAEALALGDRIAVLDRGRVQQVGTPDEVYHRPANRFVAEFFGPQGMNLIEGELKREGRLATFIADGFGLPIPAELVPSVAPRRVVCGFRPEVANYEHSDGSEWQVGGFEMNGDTTYVHLIARQRAATHPLQITIQQPTLPNGRSPPIGAPYSLRFHVSEFHWFDPITGNRL